MRQAPSPSLFHLDGSSLVPEVETGSAGSTRLLAVPLDEGRLAAFGNVVYGLGSRPTTSPAHHISASPKTPSGRVKWHTTSIRLLIKDSSSYMAATPSAMSGRASVQPRTMMVPRLA